MPMNRSGSKIPKVQVVLTIFPSPVMPDTSGVSLARKKKKKKKKDLCFILDLPQKLQGPRQDQGNSVRKN